MRIETGDAGGERGLQFLYQGADGPWYNTAWRERFPELADAAGLAGRSGALRWLDAGTVLAFAAAHKRLPPLEAFKTALAGFLKLCESRKETAAAVVLDGPWDPLVFREAVRGLALGAYRFRTYRREPEEALAALAVTIRVPDGARAEADALLATERPVLDSANFARRLVDEPANRLWPERLVEEARAVAAETGLAIEVLDEHELARQDYRGLLAVGQGSLHPPRMAILRHAPADARGPRVVLVGKGITFDTGGISLKPPAGMHEMKGDMAGAAAVLGTLRAVARLGLPVRVTGILCAAENMVGPGAQRPGDVYRHKNGTWIQVDNTDAEGRLVLADGLWRAGEEGADVVVDVATLTGACLRALGQSAAGLFSDDDGLAAALAAAGNDAGETLWRLPLIEEYGKELETPHADLRNIGAGPLGGAILAALFLREFVPEGVAWAHLDIAGPAAFEKGWKYYTPGATGFPLLSFVGWLRALAAG